MNKKIQEAMNKQIQEEMYSSYLYLSMTTYLENINLPGFAHWLRLHSQEEMFHAMKLYYHIVERGGQVKLMTLKEPPREWDSVLHVFKEAVKHEEHISRCINDLMDLSISEKDHASRSILGWFVDEQVEEEDLFGGITDKLGMIKGSQGGALFMLDREMGSRTPGQNPYVPAAE